MPRKSPSENTIKKLFAASGGLCAFPGCQDRLIDQTSGTLVGELCHITASSPGGPRYDPAMPENERNEQSNLIILCPKHHYLVDSAPERYSSKTLLRMKADHEARVASILRLAPPDLGTQQTVDLARQVAQSSIDFAILVALPKELDAVLHFFPELTRVQATASSSRSYYWGSIPTERGGTYRVVVTLLHSMGNIEAADATGVVIHDWNPRYIIVNGIAGGLCPETQDFGDIVVSNAIYYYEEGKIRKSGIERRGRQFPADHRLIDGILNFRDTSWRTRLPPRPDGKQATSAIPNTHVGPIASGEKIVASSEAVKELKELQRNLIAVEMESAGVASVAFSAVRRVGFLAIRSICDFADSRKDDRWQEYAARSAASFARAFIVSQPISQSEGTWPRRESPGLHAEPFAPPVHRKMLFDRLCHALDMEELKNLCFLTGVDIDELPGDRKSARVRELILLFERRGRVDLLEAAVADILPDDDNR